MTGVSQTFNRVQQAINAAPNGASPSNPTVITIQGRCDGPAVISGRRNLTLQGVSPTPQGCPAGVARPLNLASTIQGVSAATDGTDEVVRITTSTNIVVQFLNIVDGPSVGVNPRDVTPVTIHCNCIARNGDHGVDLRGGGPNKVTNNISRENGSDGIRLDNGEVETMVLKNCVELNRDDGIELEDSPTERNMLDGNVVRRNVRDGIDLDDSDENTLTNNEVTNNGTSRSSDCGIELQNGADVNVVDDNVIRNNIDGLTDQICCNGGTGNTGDNVTSACR